MYKVGYSASALKQSVGARNLAGIWLSYQGLQTRALGEWVLDDKSVVKCTQYFFNSQTTLYVRMFVDDW